MSAGYALDTEFSTPYTHLMAFFSKKPDETVEARLLRLEDQQREFERGLEDQRRELRNSLLDFEALYEKIHRNLAKLRKRAQVAEEKETEEVALDPLAKAREALISRKLNRTG